MDTFIILFLSMLLGSGKAVCPVNDEPLKFPEYADSVFLEIKGNLYEHPEYIWQHQDIWTRAGERLEQHLFVENGRFVWDIERGSDIKISENIFEWFTSTWKDGNEKLATGHFEIDTLDGRKWAVPKPGYNLLGEKIDPGKQEVMRIAIDTIGGKAQVTFQKEDTFATDGTNFRDLSFDEGLAAARAEGKLLFVDCYTTWCGPCKNMTNNVFPQKAASDYFNPRFVCIKVDMEKGEGPELSERFDVHAYPTFLILRPDGTLQHKTVGGDNLENFIARIEKGLDETNNLEAQKRRYAEGNMDNRQLMAYWQTLAEAADPDEEKVYDELISRLSDQEKTQADFWGIYHSETCQIGTPVWQFMLAHLPELRANNGTEKVDRLLIDNYWDLLSTYIMGYNKAETIPFEVLVHDVPTLGVKQQDYLNQMLELADLVYHKQVKELAKLIKKRMPDMSLTELQTYAFGFRGIAWGLEEGEALPDGYAKTSKQLAALALTRMEGQADSLSAQDLEVGSLILSGFLSEEDPESYDRMANLIEQALPRLPEGDSKRMLQYTLEDWKRITNKKQ